MVEQIQSAILSRLDKDGVVEDTTDLAQELGMDSQAVVGAAKSLEAAEMILTELKSTNVWRLTEESQQYVAVGASAELQLFRAIPEDGIDMAELMSIAGPYAEVGFRQAMQQKLIRLDKSGGAPKVLRAGPEPADASLDLVKRIDRGEETDTKTLESAKKRKLAVCVTLTSFRLTKGPKFALERQALAAELTQDMIVKGTWRETAFKEVNWAALGLPTAGGHLHPLLKVRTQFRKIFFQMGFEEMPTNNYVESSFWNFDVLFQPQQHPARDAHDTFFLTDPSTSTEPETAYLERVRTTHEKGGYGSLGYNYDWKIAESQKNLLRTHTTAVSSRMLYKLAQEGFRPAKYFSVDRVFRNEAIDRTHLAEFHQVEGLVCDRGLTLGHLIGVLQEFFQRLGMKKLRFKPAFNPYTEPSMEIFSYSEELGKWMEVGNSGVFRPEMLRPMGLPEDVTVIAWGLSLERPTMILYGIGNIRDLFGHRVSLATVKKNPICRLGF